MEVFEEYDDILSVRDLCRMLHIGKNAAYKMLQNNDIHSVRAGHCILRRPTAVERR